MLETEPDSLLNSGVLSLLLTISPSLEATLGIIAIVLLLIGSALISASEVAYFSLTPNDFERLQQESVASSKRILRLKDRPRMLLATILISNNFVNIAIVILSDYVLKRVLPAEVLEGWARQITSIGGLGQYFSIEGVAGTLSFLITVVGVTFLLVLFGEVAPKVYARLNNIYLARMMSGPLIFLMQVFSPVSTLLVSWTKSIERKLAIGPYATGLASREDIDEAIDLTVSKEEDAEQQIDILKSILKFGDVTVRQIMRARVDVVAIDFRVNYQELLQVVRESGYSRIPVYDEDFDNVTGILYVKDLLGHLHEEEAFEWQQLIRTNVLFVPETKKISDLLKEFQRQHLHMAIVVDEYGGTSGIVTLEDIMEEVIGEIKDEFDDEPEVIYQKVDDNNYIFEGKTLLNDVCRVVGVNTSTFDDVKGDADSFAGLVLELLGDMPKEGQELSYNDFQFRIVSVNERRIERILITIPSGE